MATVDMLKIRAGQMHAMRAALGAARQSRHVQDVLHELLACRPELRQVHAEDDLRRMVEDALDGARAIGLQDPQTLLDWCYVRVLTNTSFFRAEAFRDILDHPFLHPEAKGRHLVMAFFAVQRLQQPTSGA